MDVPPLEQVVEPLERARERLELMQDRVLELLSEVRAQRGALEFVLETVRQQIPTKHPQQVQAAPTAHPVQHHPSDPGWFPA